MSRSPVSSFAATSTLLIGVGLATKVFGLGRDLACSAIFGASRETDIFYMVFNVWVGLSLSIGLALSQVLVPRLTEGEGRVGLSGEQTRTLFWSALVTAALSATLLSAIVAWSGGAGLNALGVNLSESEESLATRIVRLASLAFPLVIVASIAAAYLRSRKVFFVAELPALLLNALALVGLVVLGGKLGIQSLMWGIVCGALVACAMLVSRALPLVGPFSMSRENSRLAAILAGNALLLTVLGSGGGYLVNLAENFFAIRLPAGDLSCLAYARRVVSLPVQLILPPVMTATLTGMAILAGSGRVRDAFEVAGKSMRAVVFLITPVLTLLVVMSDTVVAVIFGRGEFDTNAVLLTSSIVALMAPIAILSVIRNVMAQLMFSQKKTLLPVGVGLLGLVVYVGCALPAHSTYGVRGIVGSQIIADLCTTMLMAYLATRSGGFGWAGLAQFAWKWSLLAAVAAMCCSAALHMSAAISWPGELFGKLGTLGFGVAATLSGYVVLARVLRMSELEALDGFLGKILRRSA